MSLTSGRDMDLSDLADLGLPVVTTVTFILQRPGAKSINFGLPKTDQKSICAAEAVAAAIRGRVHDKLDLKTSSKSGLILNRHCVTRRQIKECVKKNQAGTHPCFVLHTYVCMYIYIYVICIFILTFICIFQYI